MASNIPPVKDWNKSVSQLTRVIDEWLYDDTHRDIVKRRMLHGESFYSISEKHGLSYERVREIYYEERKQVFNHIDDT